MESLKAAEFPCTFTTTCVDDESFCEPLINQQNGINIYFSLFDTLSYLFAGKTVH